MKTNKRQQPTPADNAKHRQTILLAPQQQLQEPPKDMDKVATHTVKTEDSNHLNLFPAKFVAYYPIASPYNSFSSELEIVKK